MKKFKAEMLLIITLITAAIILMFCLLASELKQQQVFERRMENDSIFREKVINKAIAKHLASFKKARVFKIERKKHRHRWVKFYLSNGETIMTYASIIKEKKASELYFIENQEIYYKTNFWGNLTLIYNGKEYDL